jgi:hypothetical protein
MMRRIHPLPAAALCAGLTLSACVSAPRSGDLPAFFRVPQQEIAAVQAFAREQERQIQACAAMHACARAHYLRALAALYEDRALAAKHFQASADAQAGPYAASSRAWIRLLEEGRHAGRDADLVQAAERVVREVLEREATVRQAGLSSSSRVAADVQAVQSLKRRIKERERQIDELTEQIEALKRVDREVRDRVKPGRPTN